MLELLKGSLIFISSVLLGTHTDSFQSAMTSNDFCYFAYGPSVWIVRILSFMLVGILIERRNVSFLHNFLSSGYC